MFEKVGRVLGIYAVVWTLSLAFFFLLSLLRPDLAVLQGTNGMTAMYIFCDLTARAITMSEGINL